MRKHRIVLADDHALMREGLKLILSNRPNYEVAGEAADGLELLGVLKNKPAPDVVVVDISMPRLRGIEAIREVKSLCAGSKVLVLTMHRDEDLLRQAVIAGADGYLLKEDVTKEFFMALEAILGGQVYISSLLGEEMKGSWVKMLRDQKGVPAPEVLTAREREVLKLIAEGASNKEVGQALCISTRTVDHHRANIMQKLNLRRAADLVKYAISRGYVS